MTITWSSEIGFGPNGTYVFPDDNGVYIIAQISNGVPNVRYVGKGNIHDRMESHTNWQNESNECLADIMKDPNNVRVKSTIISDSAEMANIEYTYYKYYLEKGHSLCNKIKPIGSVVIELPIPF